MDGSVSEKSHWTFPDNITNCPSIYTERTKTEFGDDDSARFTVVSDEHSAIEGEAPNQSEMVSETDYDRPHNRNDDSDITLDKCQTNLQALCTYESVRWAKEIVLYDAPNPNQTLTTVSLN